MFTNVLNLILTCSILENKLLFCLFDYLIYTMQKRRPKPRTSSWETLEVSIELQDSCAHALKTKLKIEFHSITK